MQQEQIYSAGLYLRLSKDDENEGESVSISTHVNANIKVSHIAVKRS